MIDIERIFPSTLRDLVSDLRTSGVAKVRWSYIWYDDQADPDQIDYFDVDGNCMGIDADRLVENYIYNSSWDFGDYELNIFTGEVEQLDGEPWRMPFSAGGAPRDDSDVRPISEWDLPEDDDEQEENDANA